MENKKRVGSSSSFTDDLFGAKESSPSSAGIFSSIFQPPSSVGAKNCSSPELIRAMQNQLYESQTQNSEIHGNMIKNKETVTNCVSNKERSSIFQERAEPCPLSSSIYYGGQEDMYYQSSSAQKSASYPNYKKDDPSGNNSHGASRGNWWQGSLYY
ncbi:Encodes a protein involved in salt tolerance [Forsythia ovata]|uniref:Encodes a protein involved in salt tolerance n=1 Tax=Forsythia ovata TaxID=205694 RepID=A0ABD1RKP5_9LAMI